MACDGAIREFFLGDCRVYGDVELHLAVDEPVCVAGANLINDKMVLVEIGVFAAGAHGRIREQCDVRCGAEVSEMGPRGVLDDGVELLGGGLLVDAAIGNSEAGAVGTSTNETTREKGG